LIARPAVSTATKRCQKGVDSGERVSRSRHPREVLQCPVSKDLSRAAAVLLAAS
jgi:hypothetical protein